MSQAVSTQPVPTATPDEAAQRAWDSLTREEQLRRTRAVLASREASHPASETMADVWAEIEAHLRADG